MLDYVFAKYGTSKLLSTYPSMASLIQLENDPPSPSKVNSKFMHARKLGHREIRLLSIQKSTSEQFLTCTLTYHNLDGIVDYSAISYAWGFVDVTYPVICDSQTFLVSETVHSCLVRLRDIGSSNANEHLFWIDSICIDQSNDVEKSHQVRLMADIYQSAIEVIVWLGEETEAITSGLNVLERLLQVEQKLEKTNHGQSAEDGIFKGLTPFELDDLGLPFIFDREWVYVQAVLELPWFSRVWIIQEFLHAKCMAFLCGNRYIDENMLLGGIYLFFELSFSIRWILNPLNPQKHIMNAINMIQWKAQVLKGEKKSLLQCLDATAEYEASDPRDKIFAVLSLTHSNPIHLINYQWNLHQVLLESAQEIIRSPGEAVRFLAQAQTRQQPDRTRIPSWLVYWPGTTIMDSLDQFLDLPRPRDSRQDKDFEFKIDNSEALTLKVCAFDHLDVLAESHVKSRDYGRPNLIQQDQSLRDFESNPAESLRVLTELRDGIREDQRFLTHMRAMIQSLQFYPTGEPVSDLFSRMFMLDNNHTASEDMKLSCEAWLNSPSQIDNTYHTLKELIDLSKKKDDMRLKISKIGALFFPATCLSGIWSAVSNFSASFFSRSWLSIARSVVCSTMYMISPVLLIMIPWSVDVFWHSKRASKIYSLLQQFSLYPKEGLLFEGKGLRCMGRRMCITKKGYLVWAPRDAVRGDVVFNLKGSNLPFILRKAEEGNGSKEPVCYKMVGSCYVHGLMEWAATDSIVGVDETIKLI